MQKGIDVGVGYLRARGKDYEMGGFDHLALVPGMGQQPRSGGVVLDHQKTIRLQAEGRRRQDQAFFEDRPEAGGDLAGGVEGLGGIAPAQRFQQLPA